MKAVILAGGLGTRLSEETVVRPKPMVEIGGRPILWHIMKLYSHFGINDFVICLGYKGNMIKEYIRNYELYTSDVTIETATHTVTTHKRRAEDWRVTLVDTGHETMTGGRLQAVADYIGDETFCMTYGDGLADIDVSALIGHHRFHGKRATVTAVRPPGRWGVMETRDSLVTGFREKVQADEQLINGGFFVLEPEVLEYISGPSSVWEQEPMAGLASDRELMVYRHEGFWQPMDTLREKHYLEELYQNGKAPWARYHDA
jgi:glucose-1-phosphate cytidylyltransferase